MTNTAGPSPRDVDSHSRLSINCARPSDRVGWGSGLVPLACSTKPKGRTGWNSGCISVQSSRNESSHTCESGDNPLLTSLLIQILDTSLSRDSTNSKALAKRRKCSVACRSVRISRSGPSSRLWGPPKCCRLGATAQTTLRKRSVAAQVTSLLLADTSCKPYTSIIS
jgi:hypothetical protein